MFRPHVDYGPYRERLHTQGRVFVPNILDDRYAEQFHAALIGETEWELAYEAGHGPQVVEHAQYATFDAARRAEMIANIARDARGRYAYAFDNYSMVGRYLDASRADHLLHRLVDVFHDERVLDFVRQLTQDPLIARVRIQATRYLPGHFLRRHDDTGYEDQKRRFAFVFNLGRGWQADWGGLLQFLDAEGRVVDAFVPTFNSLSLFRVPQLHCVSQVAAWAEAPRYALTGWFLA